MATEFRRQTLLDLLDEVKGDLTRASMFQEMRHAPERHILRALVALEIVVRDVVNGAPDQLPKEN